MILQPGLTVIRPEDAREVVQAAAAEGCPLLRLSTENRSGREGFFDAVRNSLPLDPPLVGSCSWDALSDSLWEGLHAQQLDRVVILWTDATAFAEEDPDGCRTAVEVLADVAASLQEETATMGRPTQLCVYVGMARAHRG
jgi:hypothetical protein